MSISSSKATCSRARCGRKDRSAITPVFTPRSRIIPVFHLTAITHRRDAVYPTTIVGIPPMEDFYIGDASVRIFLPVFKMNFPEIVDMALPPEGVFHNLVFVSIRKQYPYQAFKVMHGLWGMGQMMFSKYIVVVDEDCDVHNTSEVLFRLCANTDPAARQHDHQESERFARSRAERAEHRLAHGLRRDAQTSRRKLSPAVAGITEDDRRSASNRGRATAQSRKLEELNRCTYKERRLGQPSNKHDGWEAVTP